MGLSSSILHRLYHTLQHKYPDVLFFGNPAHRTLALTFDDGPHPRDTEQVLTALTNHKIRATFFLVGKYAEEHPSLVRRIYESEHQLALHCQRHIPFPLESASSLQGQLARARESIAQAAGISAETIRDIRPPYGAFTAKTAHLLTGWGYRLVMWSSIPQHWMQPLRWSIRQVLAEASPGGIIVLHDGHGHGKKVTEIVDAIIPPLKAQGYEFITIQEMHQQK